MATNDSTQPLPEEISSSLAAVWKRYTAKRPTNASTVISGNVVRCTLPDSVGDFEAGAAGEEGEEIDRADRVVNFRRDASAAVARSAHCRVLAQISDHDTDTDTATETFILDIAPARAAFGDPGWIAR